jgi:hypothetical protein
MMIKLKRILIAVCATSVLSLPAALEAQGPPGARANGRATEQRRMALEAQVFEKFLDRASKEMALDAGARTQLTELVRGSAQRRRALNQRTMDVHRRLNVAVKTPETPAATFTRLLSEHQALRAEEQKIAEDEQATLRGLLTPRQQAQYLMMWIRLQENARQIQAQRPVGPPR